MHALHKRGQLLGVGQILLVARQTGDSDLVISRQVLNLMEGNDLIAAVGGVRNTLSQV